VFWKATTIFLFKRTKGTKSNHADTVDEKTTIPVQYSIVSMEYVIRHAPYQGTTLEANADSRAARQAITDHHFNIVMFGHDSACFAITQCLKF
jgi:hypothetical protein